MEANKILLAIAILTSPDPTVHIDDQEGMYNHLAPSMQKLAIEWEILDPRETRYILNDSYHFKADVLELRKRFKELANAPCVSESQRFPERAVVNEFLAANRKYRDELRQRLEFDRIHQHEIENALQEAEKLYTIWDRVQESRRKFYYVTVRRRALNELRELVGEQAYYSSQLPPPIPLWRIPQMD